ncbi:sigma factor [Gimesia algae]|uniref:RNA polymerase sigma factor n=1 Tax=Gimesia algae TaxID=2527971 RepID=A0A517VDN1_9PLAN|nr:sigma factor [Gimesia algae]QDT91102.1 RNA polymerase sigma factor [Gimesia algae]
MSNSISPLTASPRKVYSSLLDQERLRIFNYIRTLVPHYSDAEDVYQHVCLTLWKKFKEFDRDRDFFPWVCGIAFYTARNHYRGVRHDRHHFNQDLMETMSRKREQHLSNYNSRIDYLRECLSSLTSSVQKLLRDPVIEKHSISEIAVTT